MHLLELLLAASISAAPPAEVVTLDDKVASGPLVALDAKLVTVEAAGVPTPLPLDEVLEIRFPQAEAAPPQPAGDVSIRLRDGGSLTCRQILVESRTAKADSIAAGAVSVPLPAVKAIRFRPSDPAVDQKWNDLLESDPERDILVVRAGDVLDRLEGTFSALDAANLTFLVGDTRVPIPRDKPKLFGVVFGRSAAPVAEPAGELRFRNGDRLPAKQVSLNGERIAATTTSGAAVTVDAAALASIDFAGGKVQFLSKLPPRDKQHTSYYGDEPLFDVILDHSFEPRDRPIRIERQTFRTGLVIRSRTKLIWRLNGEFRRLTAVAGIEQARRTNKEGGVVELTISADGKPLFTQRVTKSDPAIPLDLDVAGARELTVFVDYGGDDDTGDHLALGDARLIK